MYMVDRQTKILQNQNRFTYLYYFKKHEQVQSAIILTQKVRKL